MQKAGKQKATIEHRNDASTPCEQVEFSSVACSGEQSYSSSFWRRIAPEKKHVRIVVKTITWWKASIVSALSALRVNDYETHLRLTALENVATGFVS